MAVVQEAAAAAEYFPIAQPEHSANVPPAPLVPAKQSEHSPLVDEEQGFEEYLPAVQ